MTSIGDDLCQYLASLGVGALGTDLFLGFIPDKSTSTTIIETGGMAPYHDYGPEEILDRPSVQIRVRNPNYMTGRNKIEDVRNILDGIANWPINGTRYLSITAMSDPVYLGKISTSQGEAHEFAINFSAMLERGEKQVGLCGAYFGIQEWYTP